MTFDALENREIDTLRTVLFELGNVLRSMQAHYPDLRLDISNWPYVMIIEPFADDEPVPAAQAVEPIKIAPEPIAVEWRAPDSEPVKDAAPEVADWWIAVDVLVPDAVNYIQDSAHLAVEAATGVATAAKGEMPRVWTEEEDKAALQMFAGGFGYEDIAAQLGRPVGGVKFRFDTKWKAIRDQRFPPKVSQQAAPVAAPAAPSPPLSGLTGVQSAISKRLDTLAYSNGHTAKTDLDLVRRLGMGDKLQIIAMDWGDDPRKLKARFTDICGRELPSPELQKNLLVVLAARVSGGV